MKPETVVTLAIFLLVTILLIGFKLYFGLHHLGAEVATEAALWGFGVTSTCCAQATIAASVQMSAESGRRPDANELLVAVAAELGRGQRYAERMASYFLPLPFQVVLVLASLVLWALALLIQTGVCAPTCTFDDFSRLMQTMLCFFLAGATLMLAYLAIESR